MNVEFINHQIDSEKKEVVATEIHFNKRSYLKARSNVSEMESLREAIEAYLAMYGYVYCGADFETKTLAIMKKVNDSIYSDFNTVCYYVQESSETGNYKLLVSVCKDKEEYVVISKDLPIMYAA